MPTRKSASTTKPKARAKAIEPGPAVQSFYGSTEAGPPRHPMALRLAKAHRDTIYATRAKDQSLGIGEAQELILDKASSYFRECKDLQASALREIASDLDAMATRRYSEWFKNSGEGQTDQSLLGAALALLTVEQLDELTNIYSSHPPTDAAN